MCGIAGVFRFDQQLIDRHLLTRMAEDQRHRGPDDVGFFADELVGLSFRRLAILDLSSAGHQPMSSADQTCWLIFNGEIYNHNELRAELKKHGYTFRSTSDSEVILAAYQHWDVECLSRFNGMWGFALWDSKRRRLFCARDRVGVKPFYYHLNRERFIFASEIKTLFNDPQTRRMANERSVNIYLHYGLVQFEEETFFEGIKQLPPAHHLIVDTQGVRLQRYWALDHNHFRPTIRDADAIDEFRHLFFDSVRLRLQSDVPVGTCLSGGLDSSAIVCVANQLMFGDQRPNRTVIGEKQKTFSACYDDVTIDERLWIRPVIAATGAQSHEVFPTAEGLFRDLAAMVWHQDEPVAGSSIYAQWCVMRRAREAGVVVMLDGQGGDEVMCGYQRYHWAYFAGLLRSLKLHTLLTESRRGWGTRDRPTKQDWLGVFFASLPKTVRDRFNYLEKKRQATDWLGNALKPAQNYMYGQSQHPTWLGKSLEADLFFDCLPALLKYEDRSSMAHSIEARVPFLDYRLIEFMASMPDRMKIRNGQTKWLLRQSLRDILPQQIGQRRNKLGFATPESAWLQSCWSAVRDIFQDSELVRRQWLKRETVIALLEQPSVSTFERRHTLWRWLNLELWLHAYKL